MCCFYDPHNRFCMSDVNRLRLVLFKRLTDKKLRRFSPTKEALQLHILRLAYASGKILGLTLQPSDQIPSPLEWWCNYLKVKRIAVDWCEAYDVNLNDYIVPVFAKGFTFDANVWKKKCHVFHFVAASVLQQGKIVYILLESLFTDKQRRI